ncbi:efflux transporter outer membrane subunit [Ideonella sp. B7]|uniref:efflux transporter outer membrane subunit n=1 Tax=Ideonella benzenivorans TaxID=2831643 RepID=UPI001CED08E9|nr:efflux transporter outer membrane subunit [Ideonella benzenivorans]MCA6215909.1 efflux transporter outer membrane subunit [Ideonella benzenivorans]
MTSAPRSWTACRRWSGGLALLTLAGCQLAPVTPPSASLPDHYPADAADPAVQAAGPRAAVLGWAQYFQDETLRGLIRQALANNHDLRLAVLKVAEARAGYDIQRADQWPSLAGTAQAARGRTPADLSPIGRAVTGNQFSVGLAASSWELDFWGRVRNLSDAALENYLSTEEARRAATLGLIAQVANSYLALGELDERLDLARRTASSRAESLRIFRRRTEVGATSRLELTQVELLSQQAEVLVAQLMQARAQQAHALALLEGASGSVPTTAGRLDDGAVMAGLAPGLPSDLLLARPDILAAEHGLRAANANIGAARAAYFPRIALTGSYATASSQLDGLFKSGSGDWSFGPGLSLPLFDGGRRASALALAEVRQQQALVAYDQAVQGAFRDVADALAAQRGLSNQVQTLTRMLAVQNERARLAQLRYDAGAVRYLEVLDAERDRLSAEQSLVQARRALLSARVALYTALGGGTQLAASSESSPSPQP